MMTLCLLIAALPIFSQTTVVYSGLNTPVGLEAFEDDLYIAELQSNRIVKLDISGNTSGLQVVSNISNPEGLALQGTNLRITRIQNDNVSSLNVQSAIPTSTVSNTNIYGVRAVTYHDTRGLFVNSRSGNTTQILRLNDTFSATIVATIPSVDIRGLVVIGDYLYAAERYQGRIFRVDLTQSNPNSTVFKSGIPLAYDLDAVGNSLYITTETGRLYRINDVSVPNPPLTTLISGGHGALAGIEIIGQNIYLSAWGNGGRIIRYTDPTIPAKLYVDKDATGANNGSSWANAYTSLTSALHNASDNAEIWIAEGTYTPSNANRNVSFEVAKSNVKLYGGFAGNETTLNDRDLSLIHSTNKTVLSGDLFGNDIPVANLSFNEPTKLDNSLRVVNVTGQNLLIDGLSISGGYANAATGNGRFGGGLSIGDVAAFTIKNAIVEDNLGKWAGGLDLTPTAPVSTVVVENCILNNNTATGSPSFYAATNPGSTLNFTLVNCLIEANKTIDDPQGGNGLGSAGGWIRSGGAGTIINTNVINNTFVNNISGGTGTSDFSTLAISRISGGYGNVNVANNIFWGNTDNSGQTTYAIGLVNDTAFPSNLTIYNSIDEDDFSPINSNNKINTSNLNPLFTDAGNGDYSLQSNSPAIDTGDNTKIPAGINRDLLGNARIFNATVDMGVYEFGSSTLGINSPIQSNDMLIYPNPTSSILNIKANHSIEEVRILDLSGKVILKSRNTAIDVSKLSNGVYLMTIEAANDQTTTKRFIKM